MNTILNLKTFWKILVTFSKFQKSLIKIDFAYIKENSGYRSKMSVISVFQFFSLCT